MFFRQLCLFVSFFVFFSSISVACAELSRLATIESGVLGYAVNKACGDDFFQLRLFALSDVNESLWAVEQRRLLANEESRFVFSGLPSGKYRVKLFNGSLSLLDAQTVSVVVSKNNRAPECFPLEMRRGCFDGRAWWWNACGERDHLAQFCEEFCVEGVCSSSEASVPVVQVSSPVVSMPDKVAEQEEGFGWWWFVALIVLISLSLLAYRKYFIIRKVQ